MADEKKTHKRHSIVLENREQISITGVLDVLSFDEEMIVADTELGTLVVKGSNLHVNRLNLENGDLEIDGSVSNVQYEDQDTFKKGKSSFMSKLFK